MAIAAILFTAHAEQQGVSASAWRWVAGGLVTGGITLAAGWPGWAAGVIITVVLLLIAVAAPIRVNLKQVAGYATGVLVGGILGLLVIDSGGWFLTRSAPVWLAWLLAVLSFFLTVGWLMVGRLFVVLPWLFFPVVLVLDIGFIAFDAWPQVLTLAAVSGFLVVCAARLTIELTWTARKTIIKSENNGKWRPVEGSRKEDVDEADSAVVRRPDLQ